MGDTFRGKIKTLYGDQRLRFLAVGGLNTLFGLLFFYALEYFFGARIGYFSVLLITFAVILITSFALYRVFVFKVNGKLLTDFSRFASVYTVPFLANAIALPVLVSGLGWMPSIAQTLIVCFSTLFSYFGHKYFSFRRNNNNFPQES